MPQRLAPASEVRKDVPACAGRVATPRMRRRDWLMIVGLTSLHLLTFIDKPAHIDDTLYLETARGIIADPLHPLCNTYFWEQYPRPIYEFAINPPLYNYQQAMLMRIFGANLHVLHLLSAAYVFLAGVAMCYLARRFTDHPTAALFVFMLCPTILPQSNLMLDVPGMALVLAAVAAWIKGNDEDSPRWLAIGGAAAAAAVLTKYNAVIVLPVCLLYAILQRRPRRAVWMLLPCGALALWCLHNYIFMPGGAIHLLVSRHRSGAHLPGYVSLIKSAHSWGASFLFLPALAALIRPRAAPWLILLTGLPIAIVVLMEAVITLGPYTAPGSLLFHSAEWLLSQLGLGWVRTSAVWQVTRWPEHLIFLANGALLCWFVLVRRGDAWRSAPSSVRRDDLFLVLWVLAMLAFNYFLAPHFAPRYFFPAFAAAALLLVRSLNSRLSRPLVWTSIVAQAFLGLALVVSDNTYAYASRDYAARLAALPTQDDLPIAYVGHWGFQYYAQASAHLRGVGPLDPPPPVGTVVAVMECDPDAMPAWLRTLGDSPAGLRSTWRTPTGETETLSFRCLEPLWTTPLRSPLTTIGRGALLYAGGTYHAGPPYAWSAGTCLPLQLIQRTR